VKTIVLLWTSTILCLFVTLLAPGPAASQELVSGWEGYGQQGYAFISPVFSFEPHAAVGPSRPSYSSDSTHLFLVFTGTPSYLYYTTYGSTGTTQVRSPGLFLAPGLRLKTRRLNLTISPGYEVRWTQKTPSGGQTQNVTEHGVTGQASVFYQVNSLTNLNTILSFEDSNHYVWGRSGFKRQITNKQFTAPRALSIGAEVTGQGNSEIRTYSVGSLFELAFLRFNTSAQFRAGYSRQQFPDNSVRSQPYLGIGIYHSFKHTQ